MPMLLGTKGKEILQWRSSAALAQALKAKLALKWEYSSAAQAHAFLEGFLAELQGELEYEEQLSAEIAELERILATATAPGELLLLKTRYLELISAHFSRRKSVLALCGLCGQLHDQLLGKALAFAAERMLQLGQGGPPPYALLVSGDRGRGEQTLSSKNRYFFLHEEPSPRFILFLRQVAAVLQELGLAGEEMLWHGSVSEWRSFAGDTFRQAGTGLPPGQLLAPVTPFAIPPRSAALELPGWHGRLEALADLVELAGEAALAEQALQDAGRVLKQECQRPPFLQLARRVIDLPIALGLFGRWRLQRTGEHQGEIDLEQFGLTPLVMTLRVLALHLGLPAAGTAERIRQLLERGALDVELAGRVLKAFQCLMQQKILGEIRGEEGGAFCNPEGFSEAEEASVKAAVEAVLSLQKIAYQRMVGQG